MRRLAVICILPLLGAGQAPESTVTFKTTTNLVVVNVEVKDRDGNPIENLSRDDFEVLEDGKRQQLSVFEFQRLETVAPPPPVVPSSTDAPLPRDEIARSAPGQLRYQDRRLIVMFFDFSSMPTADQIRAQLAAKQFIAEKMTPADMVAVMSFSNDLKVQQDFTDDRDRLFAVIDKFWIGETSELAGEAATGEDDNAEDTGAAFTADETEFNIFNTDRKLTALEQAAKMLASMPEKKALVYFSSGVGKTGVENQSQLRATVNAAVRSNVAFYPIDARGLVAEAPLGDASVGGARGTSMFSGSAQQQRRDRFNDQQETLFTLAADTGGKSLLDSNDLTLGIVQAQENISSYYVLGYYSTNPAEDGRYRRIKVTLSKVKNARLDYRTGYYASKRFDKFTAADKERQLEDALMLGDPITDLHLALEVNYFRRAGDRYIVPIAVKVPGSEIELNKKRDGGDTRIDFIAQVRNPRGMLMGTVRDFVRLKFSGDDATEMGGRNLQYDTAFMLPPGDYSMKFLMRENLTGKMGTFESSFVVPDVRSEKAGLRLSSVVWANQREALGAAVGAAKQSKKLIKNHPLIKDGRKLIPSITKVFRKDQNLFVYFEVYEPGLIQPGKSSSLTATVSFFRGNTKTFESDEIRLSEALDSETDSLPIEFQVPLDGLTAGRYICQLNVIDEAGRKFAFRRTPLVMLP